MVNRPKAVFVCSVLFFLCTVILSAAQSAPAPAPRHVIIRAGHLLDVKTGKTLSGQVIEIEGDKIVSVGPASAAKTAAVSFSAMGMKAWTTAASNCVPLL